MDIHYRFLPDLSLLLQVVLVLGLLNTALLLLGLVSVHELREFARRLSIVADESAAVPLGSACSLQSLLRGLERV